MLVNNAYMTRFFADKSVVVLGSAPCVVNAGATYLSEFDVIVRVNDYKIYNDCNRVDVHYSYWGRSIKYSMSHSGGAVVMCKYPNAVFKSKKYVAGHSGDLRDVYAMRAREMRDDMIMYIPHIDDFLSNYNLVGAIPTTGVSAVLDVLRFNPRKLHAAGFDFFVSGRHNISDVWIAASGAGHEFDRERDLFKTLRLDGKIDWRDGCVLV